MCVFPVSDHSTAASDLARLNVHTHTTQLKSHLSRAHIQLVWCRDG